jgi:hypothetical protein
VTAAVLAIAGVQAKRQPDLGAVVHDVHARRHDADHFAAQAVHVDRLADDLLAPEGRLPEVVREDGDLRRDRRRLAGRRRRTADVGFARREQAAMRGLDTECLQQVIVDGGGSHAQRPIGGSQVDLAGRERTDRGE